MAKRALVLGGGGPVGIAWEAGVLLGLAERGFDLASIDHVIGTSAGSFVGARLQLGHDPAEIARPYRERSASTATIAGPRSSVAAAPDLSILFQKIQDGARAGRSGHEIARELGAYALQAATPTEDEFIARFAPVLGGAEWPARSFACTAFDAEDGTFKIWDAAAGVDLARAVASSCAVPGIYPPVTLGGRRYIDGGLLSTTNAHLAHGYDVVMVLAVTELLMRYSNFSADKKTPLDRERERLSAAGARVEVIELDMAALQTLGPNFMDASGQPAAVVEGLRQGRTAAARLTV